MSKDCSSMEDKNSTDKYTADLTRSLFCWYPVEKTDRILLLGGTPAQSEDLRKRAGRLTEDPQESPFDLIILPNVLEKDKAGAKDLLHSLGNRLSPEGRILIGTRNRFGIRYFAGAMDEAVQEPFDGIRGKSPLFSRMELIHLAQEAGFEFPWFYYLMPDERFVQAVYTDMYLPDGSFRDRVFSYNINESPLLFCEDHLYDDIAAEGMLPYTANYYLVELQKTPVTARRRKLIFAAISADREETGQFVTALYDDDIVEKIALQPQSIPTLEACCRNIAHLEERGIPTVPHTFCGDRIRMPRIKEESLMRHMDELFKNKDRKEILQILNLLYSDVLSSSEESEILPDEAKREWGCSPELIRPVLKEAMIDMVPFNAFFSDGKLRYYDQEFLLEKCPAKYVLFRALYYLWMQFPEAEKTLPLNDAKAVLGLTEVWESFLKHEWEFVARNRQTDRYREIYRHRGADEGDIDARVKSLAADGRGVTDRKITEAVHHVQIGLLKKFDEICRQNGLRYMAIHGTLLGAARHGGFIPWDDDVDVAMLRDDYDRLLALDKEKSLFGPEFFLQTQENDPACYYGGYAKLRDENTLATEKRHEYTDCHKGIWIDILPLDSCPESEEKLQILTRRITRLQRLIYAKKYPLRNNEVMPEVSLTGALLYWLVSRFIPLEWLFREHYRLCTKERSSSYCSILTGYYGIRKNRNLFPKKECLELTTLPFEGMRIPVPASYDIWLRQRYGNDYMELPPQRKRHGHEEVRFVFNRLEDMDGNGR